jgi:type II secretory pathway pseudopilin PulG
MNPHFICPNGLRKSRAFTLIEMIGVLAVITLLAAILIPSFIRKLDQIASDKEMASLKALGDALQSSVQRHRYIPSPNNWADVIAAERGVGTNDVMTNMRRQPRVFLVDPAMQIGSRIAGEDYTQDSLGSAIVSGGNVISPISPRMILLSSIGEPLPAGIVTGVPASTNDFNAIWNATERTLPAANAWTGWRGADDLKIQRINLSPLFVHLVLTSYASTSPTDGWYRVDSGAITNTTRDAYFLQSSVLDLFTNSNPATLATRQILTRDISYVYQQNIWRASVEGLGFAGGMDIGTIVDRFLRAPINPNAANPSTQQPTIVQAMMDYMQAYENWEASNFTDSGLRSIAVAKQDAMMTAVQGLYKYPSYVPAEIACP